MTLKGILESKPVQVPKYDFKTHSRCCVTRVPTYSDHFNLTFLSRGPDMLTIPPADVVLLEGILVLYDSHVRDMMHMKLFVDTDSDTRLARRG